MQREKPPFRADHVGSLLASGRPEGGACASRARRDRRRRAARRGGSRDRGRDRQAGSCRAEVRDRRRVPPRLVADRFPGRARWRRNPTTASARCCSRVRSRGRSCCGSRAGSGLFRPSDDRAFSLRSRAHPGHAEDDHTVAVDAAFSLRPRCRADVDLSGHGGLLPRSRRDLSQGGARLCRCGLPLSAARRGKPRLSVRSGVARAGAGARR